MGNFSFGDNVITPAGERGVVGQGKVRETLDVHFPGTRRGMRLVQAYPVLFESGEVRFFTADSVLERDPDTL